MKTLKVMMDYCAELLWLDSAWDECLLNAEKVLKEALGE